MGKEFQISNTDFSDHMYDI
jgi:hypothetical protein